MRKEMSKGGTHPVRKLIADGIERWANTDIGADIDISRYPEYLRSAIELANADQRRIGWGHAVHGLLSKAWLTLARQDMSREEKATGGGSWLPTHADHYRGNLRALSADMVSPE